jgi:Tfp pilus assembly protein PilN
MIKINLSNAKKQVDISNIGGFDFTKLKIKPLLLFMVLIYLPDFLLVPMWEEERTTTAAVIDEKQGKLSSLKRKVSQSQDLDKQIRELKAQEENLGKKLTAVKQAINEKKNPATILLYIAKNIPNELWIKELTITSDQMVVKGEALNYVSIGEFVNSMKSSVFVRDHKILNTSNMLRETDKRRIEIFEIQFAIARFDQ